MLILPDDTPLVEMHGEDGANFTVDVVSGGSPLKVLLSRHQLLVLMERGKRCFANAVMEAEMRGRPDAEPAPCEIIPLRVKQRRRA